MLHTLLTALGGILGIMLMWIAVQRLWGCVFVEECDECEQDMLAQRGICGQCGCATACPRRSLTPSAFSCSEQQNLQQSTAHSSLSSATKKSNHHNQL